MEDVVDGDRTQGEAEAPRRFSPERLARLMEISSAVNCECPNHVARLVEALASFEAYSRGCASRNAADRALHASLLRSGTRAREVMEAALEEVVRFEGITV